MINALISKQMLTHATGAADLSRLSFNVGKTDGERKHDLDKGLMALYWMVVTTGAMDVYLMEWKPGEWNWMRVTRKA